jgi:hypothetical protein
VQGLLGRRAAQSRGIYLAGPDVLHRPLDQVARYFEASARVFPFSAGATRSQKRELPADATCLSEIDVYLDDFGGPLPSADGWVRLRTLHLGRVNLGIESGDSDIRQMLGRKWRNEDVEGVIADLNSAAIPVGLIVCIGAGGPEVATRHEEMTVQLLLSLPLKRGDLVYLADLSRLDESTTTTCELGHDLSAVQERLRTRLAPLRAHTGAVVVPYCLDKQWN